MCRCPPLQSQFALSDHAPCHHPCARRVSQHSMAQKWRRARTFGTQRAYKGRARLMVSGGYQFINAVRCDRASPLSLRTLSQYMKPCTYVCAGGRTLLPLCSISLLEFLPVYVTPGGPGAKRGRGEGGRTPRGVRGVARVRPHSGGTRALGTHARTSTCQNRGREVTPTRGAACAVLGSAESHRASLQRPLCSLLRAATLTWLTMPTIFLSASLNYKSHIRAL